METPPPSKFIDRPGRLFFLVILVIFLSEMLVMFFLSRMPPLNGFKEAVLDSALLTCLLLPLLFVLVYRPFQRYLKELRISEKALQSSEAEASAISDASLDAIIVIDGNGHISYFNAAAERMLGYSREEALHRELHTFLVSPESRDEYEKRLPDFRRTGGCKVIGKPLEVTGHRKDGSTFPAELSVSSFRIGGKWHAVGSMRNITERKRMEEKLKEAAITDKLTGLLNRRGFYTLAEQQCRLADRDKRTLSLLYIDFDNLKVINDRHGHYQGDKALADGAAILKNTFRESDVIGRLGGDEFVVLLGGISAEDVGTGALKHLQEEVNIFNARRENSFEISFSVGVGHYDPRSPCSIEAMLQEADRAMYREKRKKKPEDQP